MDYRVYVEAGNFLKSYSYDRDNRMSDKNASGTRETYTYDGDGLRRTRNDGTLTTFVWDGSDYLGEV